MERIIQKLIKCLAAWRPFSFLDRFVYVEALPGPYGWVERSVDMVNQVGEAYGIVAVPMGDYDKQPERLFPCPDCDNEIGDCTCW